MNAALQLAHFFCAAYMTGIIWFVQCIQYPLLSRLGGDNPVELHREYTRRMGGVVGPVMLMEASLQLLWLYQTPSPAVWSGGVLLLIIWISTFGLQVPLHHRLCENSDAQLYSRLVRGNWIRTLAWTARALLLGVSLALPDSASAL
jgi:hypothetical protein